MACTYINPKTQNELALSNILRDYYKLEDSQESSNFLDSKVKLFFSDSFKSIFGDWINEDKELFGTRVNEFGEPNLYKDGENFYVLDLNNEKYFINNRRFEGLELYEGLAQDLPKLREEAKSKIAYYVLNKYRAKDEDITDIDNISFNLKREISEFFKDQVKENPSLAEDMEVLSQFQNDFYLDVVDFLNSINVSYNESLDEEDQSYQENLEDNGAVVGQSAIERNSKDNATASVKLMMSLLPDTNSEAEFFTGYKLLPFSQVWNDVQRELADIPKLNSTSKSGITDPYNIMLERLNKMAIQKPYIQALVEALETSSLNLQTQFVQAFFNNGKYIQDTLEVDTKNYKYSLINAAESSSKKSKLLTDAGLNFRGVFTTYDTKTKKRTFDLDTYNKFRNKYLLLNRNDKDTKGLLIQLKNINDIVKKSGQPASDHLIKRSQLLNSNIQLFSELITELGFPLDNNSLNYFLTDNGKHREVTADTVITQLDTFVTAFNYIDKFLIPNINADDTIKVKTATDKLFDKNEKYLNIYKGEKNQITSQKIIGDVAEAIAFFNQDMSEDMFFSGDKQMWAYSQASHIYDVVNILNNDAKEVQHRLKQPFNKNSHYLKLFNDNIVDGKITKPVIKIHRTNSMMEKDEASSSKDNVNTPKTDAINREIYEALLGKKASSNSIFPTAVPADKPTTLKMEIGDFINTYGYEDANEIIQLSDETIDIFLGYFEDEILTALEAKKFISDNTDINGNVDISKMTQYKHVSADGYVFDILDSSNESIFKSDAYKDRKHIRNNSAEINELVDNNPGFRKVYLGGVFKNYMTPSLSPENLIKRPDVFKNFYSEDFTPISVSELTTEQKNTLRPILNKLLSDQIKENRNAAIRTNIFRENFTRNTFDLELYNIYSADVDLNNATVADRKAVMTEIISDYTINSTIAQIEFSKIFNGSINNHKNAVDYFKRVPKTYIDGKGLRLGVTENDHKFNITVLQDMETASPYLKDMGEVGKRFYSGDKINQADAQAYITPERWKFLLERLGQFGKAERNVYDKIIRMENGENIEFSSKELKVLSTKPLKGVYYSNINNQPTYLKYSQTVLLKSLVKGSPLEGLLNKMRSQDISEAIMNSGVKVGAKLTENNNTLDILNNESVTLNSIPLDNRYWKLQQDLPNKGFKKTLLGSQIQKNIFDNFNFQGIYKFNDKTYKGEDVYENIHQALGELSNRGIAKVIKKFQIGSDYTINNWSNFAKEIAEQLRQEKVNDNIIKAVEKELTPYIIPQSKDKVISTILSIINKAAVKLKTNGGSLIQMSNFGLDQNLAENTGITWLIDKQQLAEPRRIKQEDGTDLVLPGQVFISGNIIGQYIPDWRNYSLDQLFGEDRQGGMLPKEILQMIGYRIPNQAMSSNDALQIVGILPDTYIDTIVPYTGITTKTGSDFDIDKMFIILPSLKTRYTGNLKLLNQFYRGKSINETTAMLGDLLDEFEVPNNMSEEEIIKMMFSDDNSMSLETMQSFRESVINNIFKDKDLSKKFKELHKDNIKVEKVEYVPYDESKSIQEQSTEAINNRLFEMYHSILTQPSNYDNLITPIDHVHVKNYITKELFPISNKLKDYQAFSSLYQIDMKYEFIAGKFGIGQVANQLVDSITNQIAQEQLDYYIGWGNKKKNDKGRDVTVFDMKSDKGFYDESGTYKISDTITALLNGFVDIAKDPYITRGNWNTQTTNTGAMLIRAGVHPYKVLSFLAQPALAEMVEITAEREGILSKQGSSSTVSEELKTKYLTELRKALVKNGVVKTDQHWNDFLKDLKDPTRKELNISTTSFSTNKITNRSAENLKSNITTPIQDRTAQFYLDQYLALVEYDALKPTVKEFTKSVASSKYGEKGVGKSLIENIIQTNKTSDVYYKGLIQNFNKKFYNSDVISNGYTSLGTNHKNTEVFLNSLVDANPKIFITANNYFKDIMNDMVSEIHKNKKYLDDVDLGRILEQSFYTMITSESSLFKMSDDTVQRGDRQIPKEFFYLFTKSNEITPVTLSDLIESTRQSLREENRNNFFLESLEIKEDNNFSFIGIDGLRLKPNDFTDKLIEGWRALEIEYPSLSEDLVKYAYQQSGFRYNANQIYQFIPHEVFVKNNMNNYITKVANEINQGNINPDIIKDNIYRHNWNNSKLVPFVNIKNMAINNQSAPALYVKDESVVGFRMSFDSNRHSAKNKIGNTDILTFPKFVNYNNNLYKLEGYYSKEVVVKGENKIVFDPVYYKTHKLGYKSDKGQLHEYTLYNELSESNVRENNLTQVEKEYIDFVSSKLSLIDYNDVELEQTYFPAVETFGPKILNSNTESVTLEQNDELENSVDEINYNQIDAQNIRNQMINGPYYINTIDNNNEINTKITEENINEVFNLSDNQELVTKSNDKYYIASIPESNHIITLDNIEFEYESIKDLINDFSSDIIDGKFLKDFGEQANNEAIEYLKQYGIDLTPKPFVDPNQLSLWEDEDNNCATPF